MAEKRGGSGTLVLAWVIVLMSIALAAVATYLALRAVPLRQLMAWIVPAGTCALLGMSLSFMAMLLRSGAAGQHAFSHTWFPLLMIPVPVFGALFPLWNAIKLLFLDRLNATTISSGPEFLQRTEHYKRVKLHGAGRPAGVLLMMLALAQPAVMLTQMVDIRATIGLKPVVLVWDGSPLRCNKGVREAKNLRLDPLTDDALLQIEGSCEVRLVGCTLEKGDLPLTIYIQDRGKLFLEDCKIEGSVKIRANNQARLEVRWTTLRSNTSLLTLHNASSALIEDSTLDGGRGHTLWMNGQASAYMESSFLGGVSMSGGTLTMVGGHLGTSHSDACAIRGEKTRLTLKDVTVYGRDGLHVSRHAVGSIKGGVLHATQTALDSSRDAKVTIEGTAIAAPTAINAYLGALVSVSSSKIVGNVRAGNRGKVMLMGSRVKGRLRQASSGVIRELNTGSAEAALSNEKALEIHRDELVKRYRKQACRGLMVCWNGYEGVIRGRVQMQIGANGRVNKVRLSRVPVPIRGCLYSAAMEKKLAPFYGPVGRWSCRFSGSAVNGSKMIRTQTAYRPDRGAKVFREAAQ